MTADLDLDRAPTTIADALLLGMALFDDELSRAAGHGTAPTPCEGWSVDDLVDHAADTADRATALLRGETWQADPAGAPLDRWARAAAGLREQLAATTTDDRWPLPDSSPDAKLRFHACDFAVHRWDLSVALGDERELPAGWVGFMDAFFRAQPVEALRRPRAFAAPVEPGPGDGPTRHLMAFLGRTPVAI